MLEEKGGWFVMNVREGQWREHPKFGRTCGFEGTERFPHTGARIWVIEPGSPNCYYHRESGQEDFLILAGEATLLVNGEERPVKAWDYIHCPPGVSHVLVGAGEGPCTFLAIGHRPQEHELYYPESELARRHGAEATEPTSDPRVAYSDVGAPPQDIEPPEWPIT